nr:unnamed protein product [Naegleria fowleri]
MNNNKRPTSTHQGRTSSSGANEVFYSFGFINGVSLASKWGQQKNESTDHSTQTMNISYEDEGMQSRESCMNNEYSIQEGIVNNQEIQTDSEEEVIKRIKQERELNVSAGSISSFLKNVMPQMEKELENAETVHYLSFMDYDVNWSVDVEEMSAAHELKLPERVLKKLKEPLSVTDLSWNCKGNMLGVSFGRLNTAGWCIEPGYICFYLINPDIYTDFNMDPKVTIENEESFVMKIAFHPDKHNIVAAGTYDGGIKIYKVHQDTDTLLCQTPIETYSHRDPITCLQWVKNRYDDSFLLVSMSGDGKMFLWTINNKLEQPLNAISLVHPSKGTPLGGSSLSFLNLFGSSVLSQKKVPTLDSSFILGTEVGNIYKLAISDSKMITSRKLATLKKGTVNFKEEKIEFSYDNGTGYVHTIDSNNFNKDLFMSCTNDGLVRLFNSFKDKDILTLQPSTDRSVGAKFSPYRPMVVGVVNSNGHLYMFDLLESFIEPINDIDVTQDGKSLTCLEFNPNNSLLLATGDTSGRAKVFLVSTRLSQMQPQEILKCNQLFSLSSTKH